MVAGGTVVATAHAHPRGRAVRWALGAGFLIHAAAALWIWTTWDLRLRGSLLVLIDLPLALFWASATQESLLFWSLLLGGLEWALWTALLTLLVGKLSERRRAA